jgi:hypothetical protein
VLMNTVVSGAIAVAFVVSDSVQAKSLGTASEFAQTLFMFALCWGPKLVYVWLCSKFTGAVSVEPSNNW